MSGAPVHIRSVIQDIMGRGNLPARVMVMESGGGAFFGDVFTWNEARLGFFCDYRPDIVATAEFVRQKWGKVFCSVPAVYVAVEAVA